jgi:hypothetical protein
VYKIRPKGESILQILGLGQDDMSEMHLTNYKRPLICALPILGNFLKYFTNLKLKLFCANTIVIRIQHFFIIKTYEKFSNNVFGGLKPYIVKIVVHKRHAF